MTIKEYLQTSYTSFHATANAVDMLKSAGFVDLTDVPSWKLHAGGKYFVTNNGSAVCAFTVGEQFAFTIVTSHTDSPSLKVKGSKTVTGGGVTRLNVEKYGGPILYSFLDRPLRLAGRVFVRDGGAIREDLYTSPFNLVIPSLAIHHNPTVNDGTPLKVQSDMLPILCDGEVIDLYEALGLDIIAADLYVVPDAEARDVGMNGELLTAARIDNLTSVYASIEALIAANGNGINVVYASDNEEIGSNTKQGAHSNFLVGVLKRIAAALGRTETQLLDACAAGFAVSVDNGHAMHPANLGKWDITAKVVLNGGIVVKHNVNYATDGLSAAVFKHILEQANVPYQDYYNHSDVRCGSTVGNIVAAQLNMPVVDIGLAELAMHSAAETVGKRDIELMTKALTAVFDNIGGRDK
jgi:aspartyl aminopeptidase